MDDLGLGTWYWGLGTWDWGVRDWVLGTWDWGLGEWRLVAPQRVPKCLQVPWATVCKSPGCAKTGYPGFPRVQRLSGRTNVTPPEGV